MNTTAALTTDSVLFGTSFPYELDIHILGFVSLEKLVQLSRSNLSRKCYKATNDNNLWHFHYQLKGGEDTFDAHQNWRIRCLFQAKISTFRCVKTISITDRKIHKSQHLLDGFQFYGNRTTHVNGKECCLHLINNETGVVETIETPEPVYSHFLLSDTLIYTYKKRGADYTFPGVLCNLTTKKHYPLPSTLSTAKGISGVFTYDNKIIVYGGDFLTGRIHFFNRNDGSKLDEREYALIMNPTVSDREDYIFYYCLPFDNSSQEIAIEQYNLQAEKSLTLFTRKPMRALYDLARIELCNGRFVLTYTDDSQEIWDHNPTVETYIDTTNKSRIRFTSQIGRLRPVSLSPTAFTFFSAPELAHEVSQDNFKSLLLSQGGIFLGYTKHGIYEMGFMKNWGEQIDTSINTQGSSVIAMTATSDMHLIYGLKDGEVFSVDLADADEHKEPYHSYSESNPLKELVADKYIVSHSNSGQFVVSKEGYTPVGPSFYDHFVSKDLTSEDKPIEVVTQGDFVGLIFESGWVRVIHIQQEDRSWNVGTYDFKGNNEEDLKKKKIKKIALNAPCALLATGEEDGAIRIYDIFTHQAKGFLNQTGSIKAIGLDASRINTKAITIFVSLVTETPSAIKKWIINESNSEVHFHQKELPFVPTLVSLDRGQFLISSQEGRVMAFKQTLEAWFDYNCNLWSLSPFFEFKDYMVIVKPMGENSCMISIRDKETRQLLTEIPYTSLVRELSIWEDKLVVGSRHGPPGCEISMYRFPSLRSNLRF